MRENREIARREYKAHLVMEAEGLDELRFTVRHYSNGARERAIRKGRSIYQQIYHEMKENGLPVVSAAQVKNLLEGRIK